MFCSSCGANLSPAAKFCSTCGAAVALADPPPAADHSDTATEIDAGSFPVEEPNRDRLIDDSPSTETSRPEPKPEMATAVQLPQWLPLDWTPAALGAASFVAAALGLGAILSILLATTEFFENGPPFLVTLLAASSWSLGSTVGLESTFGGAGYLSISVLPLPALIFPALAVRHYVNKFGAGLRSEPQRFAVFAGKLALVAGLSAAVVARLASIDFTVAELGDVESVSFATSSSRAFLITLLVAFISVMTSHNRPNYAIIDRWSRAVGPALRTSALAVAALMLVGLLVGSIDWLRDEDLGLTSLLFILPSVSVTGALLTIGLVTGAPVDWVARVGSESFSEEISLITNGSGWELLLLLAAPAALGIATYLRLLRDRPSTQEQLIALATRAGFSFGVLIFVGVLVSRFSITGGSGLLLGDITLEISASVNPGLALLLGVLWGLLGAFTAALIWGRSNGLPLVAVAGTTPTDKSGGSGQRPAV